MHIRPVAIRSRRCVPAPVTVQSAHSLVARGADHGIAEVLHREGMSLLAYSPLAGGILTGKYSRGLFTRSLNWITAASCVARMSSIGPSFSTSVVP